MTTFTNSRPGGMRDVVFYDLVDMPCRSWCKIVLNPFIGGYFYIILYWWLLLYYYLLFILETHWQSKRQLCMEEKSSLLTDGCGQGLCPGLGKASLQLSITAL